MQPTDCNWKLEVRTVRVCPACGRVDRQDYYYCDYDHTKMRLVEQERWVPSPTEWTTRADVNPWPLPPYGMQTNEER